jgi:hypothetical protein
VPREAEGLEPAAGTVSQDTEKDAQNTEDEIWNAKHEKWETPPLAPGPLRT